MWEREEVQEVLWPLKRVVPATASHTHARRFRTDSSSPRELNLRKLLHEGGINRGGLHVSLIRQRPNGEALTQGAMKYLHSFEAPSETQRRLALQGAAKLMREAENSPEELIRELATALWWLTLYRIGVRPTDRQPVLAAWLAPAEATLRRLSGLSGEAAAANNGGLHLRDISPADEDKEFEVSEDG
jgi:hypothetical protein